MGWEEEARAQAMRPRTGPPKLSPRGVRRPDPAPGPIFPVERTHNDAVGRALRRADAVLFTFNDIFGGRFSRPSSPFGSTGLGVDDRRRVMIRVTERHLELSIDGTRTLDLSAATDMEAVLGPLLVEWAKQHDLHGQ